MGETNQISTLPAVIQRAITEQRIDLDAVTFMLPTQTFGQIIGEYDKVVIEVVTVNPDPKAGEVAEFGGKLALGRVPLEKISSAVGIVWDPIHTTILESTETKSRAKAVCALRKPNGEWLPISEEKTVDLPAFEEEQRIAFEERAEKGNFEADVLEWGKTKKGNSYPLRFTPWKSEEEKRRGIDMAVRKAMVTLRKFKDERATTGAKERCIRAILALKHSYDPDELAKPLAFPRVIPDTSKMLANPELRAAAIDRMTGAAATIFGPDRGRAEGEPRNITPAPAQIAAPAITADEEPDFGDAPTASTEPVVEVETPLTQARSGLQDWLANPAIQAYKPKSGKIHIDPTTIPGGMPADYATPADAVQALLDRQDATLPQIEAMIRRCQKIGGST